MCYSAMVTQYWKGMGTPPKVDYAEFSRLISMAVENPKILLPKAMLANFYHPTNGAERQIGKLVREYEAEKSKVHEVELFKQTKRLNDAQRTLTTKVTKKATSDQRIATDKIKWNKSKLSDIKRRELKAQDSRIFPLWYCPVFVREGRNTVVRPMRYQCRQAGTPAFYDEKFPGTYNARRDNLLKFWKRTYGHSHGYILVTSFYENVSKHRLEGRELGPDEKEENVRIYFNPRPSFEMKVACLWSRWTQDGESDLLSFAAITDEPPAEVAAAGHDRCIIPIKDENINRWLQPESTGEEALSAILDDRERPFYVHRLAA